MAALRREDTGYIFPLKDSVVIDIGRAAGLFTELLALPSGKDLVTQGKQKTPSS